MDDVHLAPDPYLAVISACRAGRPVLAACREDGFAPEHGALDLLADQKFVLEPFSDAERHALFTEAARGVPLAATVVSATSAALGSLAGNPGAVCGTFAELRRVGRLVPVKGQLCLVAPDEPIPLPAENDLVRLVVRLGPVASLLLVVVAEVGRFRLDTLWAFAAAVRTDVDVCGAVVDHLVAARALECDEHGVLRSACDALVAAALRGVSAPDARRVHRAIVERLHSPAAAAPEPSFVAEHVVCAGDELPASSEWAVLLIGQADGVLARDPVLAARWYRAALPHCDVSGAEHARVLSDLQRLLVRIGHYHDLHELVAYAIKAGLQDGQRQELALSAALGTLYTGVRLPEPVHDVLAPGGLHDSPLELCGRWLTEFAPDGLPPAVAGNSLAATGQDRWAGGWHDVESVLRSVCGPEHGRPVTGPVAAYLPLRQSYLTGDWSVVPGCARTLELSKPDHPLVHPLARLLTAEVLACQGDLKGAKGWFDLVDERCAYPAARALVETGMAMRSGEFTRASVVGWAAFDRLAGDGCQVGLSWLLVRLAHVALRVGDTEELRRACAEVKAIYLQFGGVQLQVAKLMVCGMAERDAEAAVSAVEILREQGNVPGLMSACVVAGFACDDPGGWFHEAYDIAKRLGDDWMRSSIRTFMVTNGVTPPRQRSGRAELSAAEESIIRLLQQGMTNRQIAAAVQLSEKTVESHLTRLFAKTGCRSRLDLAKASLEGRLVLTGLDRVGSA
ncbi:LuxR C-terminal-related transcriptional regulator [Lentzea sp. JNUCC 0626]|uniref:helix-turn-helix transcriptional regulator n=1 Tax=Lentzea sp. JNUCC 0626 TaxID=3367513 RepID=UPI003747FE47